MRLSITRNGVKEEYSERQFRLDNPSTSFPKDLVGVDLAAYGIEAIPEIDPTPVSAPLIRVSDTVPMHCFLWGVREFGLRVQFERYILEQEGHARDYWFTAPYARRASTYVQHAKQYFMLKEVDLDTIFLSANSIEE